MKLVRYSYFLLLILMLALWGCFGSQTARQSRYNKKQEKIMLKQMEKEYEYALEHHYKMQSERTQNMMKQSKKHSKRVNNKRKKEPARRASSCISNKSVGAKNDGE